MFPRPDQLDSRDIIAGRPQSSSEQSETKVLWGPQFMLHRLLSFSIRIGLRAFKSKLGLGICFGSMSSRAHLTHRLHDARYTAGKAVHDL